MVTVRYSDIKYNKSKNNYYIDQNWYKEQKEIKKISDEAVFIASFHHDELIGIVKKKVVHALIQEMKTSMMELMWKF